MNELTVNRICYYHSHCPDGAGAAIQDLINNPNSTLIPYDHKDRDKILEHLKQMVLKERLDICFLDVCPSFSYVKEIAGFCNSISIVDHHKPACEKFLEDQNSDTDDIKNIYVTFDYSKSACQIVWGIYHPNEEYSDPILHLGNKDIWKWTDSNTEPFCLGYPEYYKIPRFDKVTPEELLEYFRKVLDSDEKDVQKIIEIGNDLISTYRKKSYEIFIQKYFYFWKKNVYLTEDTDKNGKLLKVVQVDKLNYNLIKYFIELLNEHHPDYDLLRIRNIKDYDISYSLRTLKGANVALLAQKYGGNGHPGASGYGSKRNRYICFFNRFNNYIKDLIWG